MLLKRCARGQAALHSITSDLLDLLKIFACGLQYGIPFPSDSWGVCYVLLGTGWGSNRFAAQEWVPVPMSRRERSSPDLQIDRVWGGTLGTDELGLNPCLWRGPAVALDYQVSQWSSKSLLKWRMRDSCSELHQFLSWISSFLSSAWQYQCRIGLTPSSLPCSRPWSSHLAFSAQIWQILRSQRTFHIVSQLNLICSGTSFRKPSDTFWQLYLQVNTGVVLRTL